MNKIYSSILDDWSLDSDYVTREPVKKFKHLKNDCLYISNNYPSVSNKNPFNDIVSEMVSYSIKYFTGNNFYSNVFMKDYGIYHLVVQRISDNLTIGLSVPISSSFIEIYILKQEYYEIAGSCVIDGSEIIVKPRCANVLPLDLFDKPMLHVLPMHDYETNETVALGGFDRFVKAVGYALTPPSGQLVYIDALSIIPPVLSPSLFLEIAHLIQFNTDSFLDTPEIDQLSL